jgi:hypothetical protein
MHEPYLADDQVHNAVPEDRGIGCGPAVAMGVPGQMNEHHGVGGDGAEIGAAGGRSNQGTGAPFMQECGHGYLPAVADSVQPAGIRNFQIGKEYLIEPPFAGHLDQGAYFDPFAKGRSDRDDKVGQSLRYLKNTEADLGGTELLNPLKKIYSTEPVFKDRVIFLLSDGEVGNEEEIMELAGKNVSRTRLFTVGIRAGSNEYLIKGLARASRGAWEFIFPGERIEPKVLRIFEKISNKSLDDLVINWTMDGVEQAPGLPAVFPDFPQTIFARGKAATQSSGPLQVKGKNGNKEQEWYIDVVAVDAQEIPIPVLWARERIRNLEDFPGGLKEPGSRQEERRGQKWKEMVISLSKEYNILSKFTSYVAIEEREEKDKTAGPLVLRKVPVMVTEGWNVKSTVSISFHRIARVPHAERVSPAYYFKEKDLEVPTFIRKGADTILYEPAIKGTINPVLSILSLQTAEGGLLLDRVTAKSLGIKEKEIKKYAKDMKVDGTVDPFLLLSTAILFEVLEQYFQDQSSLWERPIQKSRDWMNQILQKGHPRLYDKDLVSWVKGYVKYQIHVS